MGGDVRHGALHRRLGRGEKARPAGAVVCLGGKNACSERMLRTHAELLGPASTLGGTPACCPWPSPQNIFASYGRTYPFNGLDACQTATNDWYSEIHVSCCFLWLLKAGGQLRLPPVRPPEELTVSAAPRACTGTPAACKGMYPQKEMYPQQLCLPYPPAELQLQQPQGAAQRVPRLRHDRPLHTGCAPAPLTCPPACLPSSDCWLAWLLCWLACSLCTGFRCTAVPALGARVCCTAPI